MAYDDTWTGLRDSIRDFATARDWEQFHTPRNLVLALLGEAGELAAELQWIPDADVPAHLADADGRRGFEDELADVVIYALRLADVASVDLAAAVRRKIAANELRYPVATSRGSSRKQHS